jgi:prepilin-type N-terminal cleavage/methylation domain-containing protein
VSRHRIAKENASAGYSLVELLIVVALATILLTVAVPGIARIQQEWTLWGAARVLEVSMQWGRMHAIASNAPVVFCTDDVLQEFYWADVASGEPYDRSRRHLPSGVRIAAAPRRPLRFYPHGNAAPAGTYTVAGEAGSYSVVVTPGGRIRTQKN